MSEKEIDYWLNVFKENNVGYHSHDGKKISLFKVFDILKEMKKENQKYKEVIDRISKILHEIDKSIKATGGYPSNYIDELLDILKEVE